MAKKNKTKTIARASRRMTAFRLGDHPAPIRPGVVRRQWMDDSPQRFAYRCLPLTVANTFGWELLSPATFEATWYGGPQPDDIHVKVLSGDGSVVTSHFGTGVLTFHPGYLFRTESGISLMATGSPNAPKDGIAPLAGVIETSWAPYPFTMNWRFTRPEHTVRFEEGEPFCFLFPVQIGLLETTTPEIDELSADPRTQQRYQEWLDSRVGFIKDLKVEGSEARDQEWQKRYSRGQMPDGSKTPYEHHSAVSVRPFTVSERTRQATAAQPATNLAFDQGEDGPA